MGCLKLKYYESETAIGKNWKIFVDGIEKTASSQKICKDYYAFGMMMPGRSFSPDKYRFGFNGMEKDDEVKGGGNSYTTMFRQYDPRLGRWLTIDPVTYEGMSPYNAFDNNPITIIDPSGSDGRVFRAIHGSLFGTQYMRNSIILYNDPNVRNRVSQAQLEAMDMALPMQLSLDLDGQTFNDGRTTYVTDAWCKVYIAENAADAERLAASIDCPTNIFMVTDQEGSYVRSDGRTGVLNYGNHHEWSHEWLHLFGLTDRYVIGININSNNTSFQLPVLTSKMFDNEYVKNRGQNIMSRPGSSSDITSMQMNLLWSKAMDDGLVIPSSDGWEQQYVRRNTIFFGSFSAAHQNKFHNYSFQKIIWDPDKSPGAIRGKYKLGNDQFNLLPINMQGEYRD